MVAPWLDHGLTTLRTQLWNEHPGMVIGWIGDPKHQAEKSDHNPSTEKHDEGSVDAIDPMLGPNYTREDAQRDVIAIVASRDPRIAYIIWEGHIISSTVQPWKWRTYDGSDPHTGHWHISVNDLHEQDRSPWSIYEGDTMSVQDAETGFMTVLAEAANAALPDGDPRKEPTTQIGRNAVIFIRRILSPMLAADNDALVQAVIAAIPVGSNGSTNIADVETAVRNVLTHGVAGN